MNATLRGHIDIVQLLIDGHAQIDHIDQQGITALSAAAELGHGAIVKRLD